MKRNSSVFNNKRNSYLNSSDRKEMKNIEEKLGKRLRKSGRDNSKERRELRKSEDEWLLSKDRKSYMKN